MFLSQIARTKVTDIILKYAQVGYYFLYCSWMILINLSSLSPLSGFVVDFISMPVTVGFTAAAAITIGSSQIKSLLGQPGSGNDFLQSWINFFKYITDVQLYDSILGLSTIVLLLLLKKVGTLKRWPIVCKYLALSRNAIVVILGALLAYLLMSSNGSIPFGITGQVASGFPTFAPPEFSVEVNGTTLSFGDMISELGTDLLFIPVVAILEMVAVAKAFCKLKSLSSMHLQCR